METEAVYLRIGSVAITAEGLLLPVAGAFFALLFYRKIHPELEARRSRAVILTVVCCLCAGIGARLYGFVQPFHLGEPVLAQGAWVEARFGSFGAIWAILGVLALYGRSTRNGALAYTDAAIPANCAGLAIARISCLFQGCCPSIPLGHVEHWLDPVYVWPSLDLAAIGVVLVLALAARNTFAFASTGYSTVVFLCGYGLARFGIEFLRDTYTLIGPFTYGHVMAISQLAVGLYVLGKLTVPSAVECRRYTFAPMQSSK